jgi:anionic cell wall polymer biosynthesis LytR-Cps2A-Psr (LCP) family protein
LRYARTRHQDSDFARVRRQQAVMMAVARRAASLDAVTKLPELVGIAGSSFRTDMSLAQMIAYALAGQQLDLERVETLNFDQDMLIGVQGRDGAGIYMPDRDAMAPLIRAFLQ